MVKNKNTTVKDFVKRSRNIAILGILVFLLFSISASGRENVGETSDNGSTGAGGQTKAPVNCLMGSSKKELNINNVRAVLLNGGDMWWDQGGTSNARYEIPKIDDPTKIKKHSLFAGAIWIGGVDNSGNVLVTAQTYRSGGEQSYFPGPIVDASNVNISAEECGEWDKHFIIDRQTVDQFRQDFMDGKITSEEDVPEDILLWPGRNNPYLQGEMTTLDMPLAPYINEGGTDEQYDPMDGDYPDFLGDQAIWWIMNDVGGPKSFGDATITDAIGLEISTMAFAFATNDQINNMTFNKNIIKNKGSKTLLNTYIGQWVDPDLGNFDDDFVGCDVSRGLGICYNGKTVDAGFRGYGENPPAVGVDFFRGPIADENDGIDNDHDCVIDELGETIVMSNFLYYNNTSGLQSGNPNRKVDFYNYLQNIWRDGSKVTYDGQFGMDQSFPQANYMYPGVSDLETGWGFGGTCSTPIQDEVKNFEWSENTAGNEPADRRFLQSAGPFTLKPGAVNEVTVGVVWCRSGSGGPTGSLTCLKIADDKAQTLFDRDFKILNGPDAPNIDIVELDQELVLAINPRTIFIDGEAYDTETYFELDRKLEALAAQDPYFRFQGYKVYQLSASDVTVSDIENPDLARLIAQCDVSDGISKLINTSFDPDIETFIPELKIIGNDDGLFHTLHLTQDAFTSERLVNFKKYHYLVLAYASNVDSKNDIVASDGQQYLLGRKNVKVSEGMPHKTENRSNGTILNATYGSGIDVEKVHGVGNGGKGLQLTADSEQKIYDVFTVEKPEYVGGNAPVNVKVYDPINVQLGEFKLKLFSRLVLPMNSITSSYEVGDIIEAEEIRTTDLPNYSLIGDPELQCVPGDQPQIAGVAEIVEIYESESIDYELESYDRSVLLDPLVTNPIKGKFIKENKNGEFIVFKVRMLNDYEYGTFMFDYKRLEPSESFDPNNNLTQIIPSFSGYRYFPYTVHKQGFDSDTVTVFDYTSNDLWELYDLTKDDTIDGQKRISEFNEQILPEYGIALELSGTHDPLYRVLNNPQNGFISAEIEYGIDGEGTAWLEAPELEDNTNASYDPWMELIPPNPDYSDIDPAGTYRNVMDGSWSSYSLVKTVTGNISGASYIKGKEKNKIYDLSNIDVVLDASRPSKCVVLQFDKQGGVSSDVLVKSQTGDGMGEFPGYAIDIDRGIRLNLFFSESKLEDPELGDNLIWDLTDKKNGTRSYIYVTNTLYDEGANYSQLFDEIRTDNSLTGIQRINTYANSIFKDITWVGNLKVKQTSKFMASDVTRIRLRVNKQYRSDITESQPEYEFNTSGVLAEIENISLADSVLQCIRMVPNPYFAYSEYESFQFDNRVKITNLPQVCTIRIFNTNGEIVRVYRKSSDVTFIDWDLKNEIGIPISGGAYFAHIKAPELGGEIVVKWFGVVRQFDIDTF